MNFEYRLFTLRHQDNQRMKYGIHLKSFHDVNSVERPKNTGCRANFSELRPFVAEELLPCLGISMQLRDLRQSDIRF